VIGMKAVPSHPPPAIDGTHVEGGIYENILAAYQRTLEHGKDPETTGSRIAAIVARLMKEGGNAGAGMTRNSVLLLLSHFLLQDTRAGLYGKDFNTLGTRERDSLLADLASALPGA
jgi:hypothetical protein